MTGHMDTQVRFVRGSRVLPAFPRLGFTGTMGAFLLLSVLGASGLVAADTGEIVFEDWSKPQYRDTGWVVEGLAFGNGPIAKSRIPGYQGDVGGDTDYVVNSHASAPGGDPEVKDRADGVMRSRSFVIEKNFMVFG